MHAHTHNLQNRKICSKWMSLYITATLSDTVTSLVYITDSRKKPWNTNRNMDLCSYGLPQNGSVFWLTYFQQLEAWCSWYKYLTYAQRHVYVCMFACMHACMHVSMQKYVNYINLKTVSTTHVFPLLPIHSLTTSSTHTPRHTQHLHYKYNKCNNKYK